MRSVIFFLLLSLSAHAELCPKKPIRISFLVTTVLYDAEQDAGFDKDVIDELQARTNCAFEKVQLPRARTWVELEKGNLDMTTSVLVTPEREKTLWTVNYIKLRSFLLVDKEQALGIKTLDDFLSHPKKPNLGVVIGYKYGHDFDEWIKKLTARGQVQFIQDTNTLYKMLKHKRFAAVIGTPLIYRSQLELNSISDRIEFLDLGGESASIARALGFSKKTFTTESIPRWAKIIHTMYTDGTTRRILSKYVKPKDLDAVVWQK